MMLWILLALCSIVALTLLALFLVYCMARIVYALSPRWLTSIVCALVLSRALHDE